ncbi:MAG: hypothetical protein HZA62_13925 [Rhodocyclales bacterium]|nr:hypothetical protein [Rhodocyclales bacterium]
MFTLLAFIAGAPILFAFLLAGTPVLIPLLAYRWLRSGTDRATAGITALQGAT